MSARLGYTCRGDVRGDCGRTHRTIAAALRCCGADQVGCARQGGYSDRTAERVDREPMTTDEVWIAEQYADAQYDR